MATLGSLVISLEANIAKFESAMTKAEYAAKKASDNIVGALKVVGVAMAGMFSLSAMDKAFSSITTMESNLLKVANRLNTTVETLSSFSVMARKTGMDSDAFNMALTRMEKGLSAAAKGAETATGKFDEEGEEILKVASTYAELGLKAEVVAKMPLEQQLLAMATAMKANIAPSDQVRIAMELFGRGGAGMVAILKEGPEAMQKWIDRATELGLITTDMAKRGAEAKTAAGDLTLAWSAFGRELVDGVAPAISTVLNLLTDMIAKRAQTAEVMAMVHSEGAWNPETMASSWAGSPTANPTGGSGWGDTIADAMTAPSRSKPVGAGGGKGKGGGGLDRMQSIIDGLWKDLNKLTEGSLAEIDAWSSHVRTEIEKVGKKGAETETALSLVTKVESAKKEKAAEEYALYVAKVTGDTYKEIETQGKLDLIKYKGFSSSKAVIDEEMAKKKLEADRKNEVDRDVLQKSYYEGMANITRELKEQYEWKKKALELEIKMNRAALEDSIKAKGKGMSPSMADEQRQLLAMTNQTKRFALEWEKVQGTTQQVGQLFNNIGASFINATAGMLQGSMTLAKGINDILQSTLSGIMSMLTSMVGKWVEAQVMIMALNYAASQGQITNEAAVAGAKAYSAYASIPFVGLALGAAAAAAVMGIMMALGSSMKSSAGGDYQVSSSGLRMVHEDETILPAWAAKNWRDMVSGNNPTVQSKESRSPINLTINHTPHYNYKATQQDYDRDAKLLTRAINRELNLHGKAPLGRTYG